jgi:hypothetical protein
MQVTVKLFVSLDDHPVTVCAPGMVLDVLARLLQRPTTASVPLALHLMPKLEVRVKCNCGSCQIRCKI